MRINNLIESKKLETDDFVDMTLSDALFVLSEMAEDDKLSLKEIDIIEEMFERLVEEEIDESIVDHGDTQNKRLSTFKKTKSSDRIKNRLAARKLRRTASYKMKLKKRAEKEKHCKGNTTAQLSKPGASTYVCKPKNKFRSKLMKLVARRYNS